MTFSFAGRHSKFEHGHSSASTPESNRQRLVVIGRYLKPEAVRAELDACLLTDEEMKGGAATWRLLPIPFDELG